MSDARGEFFASGSSGSGGGAAKPKGDARAAFFADSGGDGLDSLKPVPGGLRGTGLARPRGMSAEQMEAARRGATDDLLLGLSSDPMAVLKAGPAGINRGAADLLGVPMDFIADGGNLLGMGYGAAAGLLTGEPASDYFEPVARADRGNMPLTGEWFAQKLDDSAVGLGGSPVTQLQDPENAAARLVYGAAQAIPGASTGRQVLSGAAGGGAAAVASEATGDPTLAAAAGLAGGRQPVGKANAKAKPERTPQQMLNESAAGQSMGAAGAAVDLNTLSPKLRANVEQAVGDMGGSLSPEQLAAVVRYKRAESLPAPVYMTQGQALGDSHLSSIERNARGKHEAYTKGFDAQDKALTKNLEMMRDEAGPDVFTTNTTQHGDTLIGRYEAIDDAANAEISQNYQALRDAAGGEFPVDTQALLTNTKSALKKDLSTNSAPPDVMALLEESATNGKMSFEDFESLRTALSRIQRSSSDGQARHAAGVIRDQVEQMPLIPEAASLKQIADTARNSARARFQALDADPAYKAAVEGKVSPDAFVQKFLTGKGATRDSVTKLVAAMAGDEAATQTVHVATLDHLRDAARIDPAYKGTFANAGYNKAIRALEEQSKLDLLLGQKTAETSRELGQVAFDLKHQSEGSFFNNSGSTVAALAEKATDALEGILNYKTGGIPIASAIRKNLAEGRIAKEAEKTFEPGAGLQKLSDLSKLEKKK